MSYFRKERFSMNQLVIMLSVAMILCAVYASAVSLTPFIQGTTISASAVNTELQKLNNALPLVWASTDTGAGGVTRTASGMTIVNTVSINAPGAGFLIISGSCFVNNQDTAGAYYFRPTLDGALINGHFFLSAWQAGADATLIEDWISPAYTITIPITAGAHTIAQEVGPESGTKNFFYNKNNLTVMFLASSQGSLVTVSAPVTASPSRESETGE